MRERLTKSDIAKIEEELDRRKYVEREKISQEIKEARAQGDLSENFEYYAARRARGQNESRIAYLLEVSFTALDQSRRDRRDRVGGK